MKYIDIPPAWLGLCLIAAWAMARFEPDWATLGGWAAALGALLVAAGLWLMVWAVLRMRRAGTTVLPHGSPSALVTDGPFRLSRNPIYLGDALLLAGAALLLDAPLALLLVPVFMALISGRFIRHEEAGLRGAFPKAFDDWARRTRRWI